METERVNIELESLKFAPYNPRYISDDEFQKLKRSIQTYGFTGVLVVNKRNNQVVGGNQSLKALRELGYDRAEAVLVDLDDNSEKALNVALNKISGEWDIPKLDELFEDLKMDEYDLSMTGFEIPEINEIRSLFDEEENEDDIPPETDEDDTEVKDKNKLADVTVQIGPYRVIIARDKWDEWEENLFVSIGMNSEDITDELLKRLGL